MKNLGSLLILIIFSSIISNNIFAYEKKHPSPQEIFERKWDYMSKEANLTQEEQEAIKPVFMDYEQKVWTLHEACHSNKHKRDNFDYETMNDQFIYIETQQAELLKEYHNKLKNIISAETLFNFYNAERGYKRQLIYEMQQNRKYKKHMEKNKVE